MNRISRTLTLLVALGAGLAAASALTVEPVAAASEADGDDPMLITESGFLPSGAGVVILPADDAETAAAGAAGLPLSRIPWADGVYPSRSRVEVEPGAFLECEPGHFRPLDLVHPSELLGISGIPVMIDAPNAGIMPYVRPTRLVAGAVDRDAARAGAVPILHAWPEGDGWRATSEDPDDTAHPLAGIAPITWTVDGVDIDGVGVVVGADGASLGYLGQPLYPTPTGWMPVRGLHLIERVD